MGTRKTRAIAVLATLLLLLSLLAVWSLRAGRYRGPPAAPASERARVVPAADEGASPEPAPVEAAPPPEAPPGPGEADPAPWADGVLIGADGRPLAGARIHAGLQPDAEMVRAFEADHRIPPLFSIVGDRAVNLGPKVAETGEDGSYSLKAPEKAGLYDLYVVPPQPAESPVGFQAVYGRVAHVVRGIEWRPGLTASLGAITVAPTGAVFGTVAVKGGAPASGVLVSCVRTDLGVALADLGIEVNPVLRRLGRSGAKSATATAWIDGSGRFEIGGLPPGVYEVRAARKGPTPSESGVVVKGERTGPVSLVVDSFAPPLLRGHVVDAVTGLPVRAGIMFFFDCPPGGDSLGRGIGGGWSTEGEATRGMGGGPGRGSDDSGEFCIDGLKPGEYKLKVGAAGYKPATVGPFLLSAGQSLDGIEVKLEPEAAPEGR